MNRRIANHIGVKLYKAKGQYIYQKHLQNGKCTDLTNHTYYTQSCTFGLFLASLPIPTAVQSIRAGSRPKQPATGQSLAGYFLLTLLLILVRNLK